MTRPSPGPPGASLGSRALRASAATAAGFALAQLLRIASNLILTRLLFPESFGLMALVYALMIGLQMLSDLGVEPSVVQNERGEERDFLDTAWTIQAVRGVVLCACGVLIAAPYARFYGEPELLQLVPVVAASAIFAGFNSTKLASLKRRVLVGRIVVVELAAQLAGIVAMVAVAWVTRSTWALVTGALVQAFALMLLSHAAIPGEQNRFHWERDAAREIVKLGKWIFLSTLVSFLAMRLDVLLLGRLVSMDLVGVYSIALMLAQMPQGVIGRLVMLVHFPAMAESVRRGQDELAANFARARAGLLPAALLLVVSLATLAPAFFRYLYDERYWAAGWMAQLLMVGLWFFVLHMVATRTLLALGDARSLAFSNVIGMLFTAIGCLSGYSVAGVGGLILGAAAGPLTGYVSLSLALARHRLKVVRQDLAYTAAAAACGLLGGLGPRVAAETLQVADAYLLALAFAAVILGPLGLFAALRGRDLLGGGAASLGPGGA